MWVPANIEAIEQAIETRVLEETASFDGKRSLREGRKGNRSAAEDIAAMTTEGGAILYGVGEDEHERLTVRAPVALAGTADRLAQIAQTSISEVPTIEFREYPLVGDPGHGFLLVIVPKSPRAPHQVTVGGDRRFYGRGAKGNQPLSEQEIALLYARRQQQEVDLSVRLEEVVAHCPFAVSGPDDGQLHAFAQPVPVQGGIWSAAERNAGDRGVLQRRIEDAARQVRVIDPSATPYRNGSGWRRAGADVWRLSSQGSRDLDPADTANVTDMSFNDDGRCVLFAGTAVARRARSADDEAGQKFISEMRIAANTAAFLAAVAELLGQARYWGAIDVGLLLSNLQGGVGVAQYGSGRFVLESVAYAAQNYPRTTRLASLHELECPQRVAYDLLHPLFAATANRDDFQPLLLSDLPS